MSQVPKHFQIESRRRGGSAVVRLGGEFDVACEEHFDRIVEGLVAESRTIVVDLSELSFIDSSGLRALLRAWKRCEAAGASLTVTPGTGQVSQAMALTGADELLPIVAEAPLGAPVSP
jgi:anti-anti-sigma factor